MTQKQRQKKNTSAQEINKTLRSIYSGSNGKKFDMKVQKAPTKSFRKILIGFIIFFGMIAVVSWLGILVFSRFSGFGGENIGLFIIGDKKVEATLETEYEIKYANKGDIPLAGADLGLYFPKSFVLTSSEPALGDKNTLKIGSLKPGETGSVMVKGRFFASEGEKQSMQAVLSYKPSNFNSVFERVGTLDVEISGSAFDGSLEGPDKVVSGEIVSYKLNYQNKGNEDLKGVVIDVDAPQEFIIATSTPELRNGTRFEIGDLKAKSEGEVVLRGSFDGNAKGEKGIVFKLGVADNEGAILALIEKKIATEVVGGDFSLDFLLNGANNFNTARWGDGLNYSITYKNEGKDTLYDIKIKLNIKGVPDEQGKSIVNWDSMSGETGKRSGDYVIWTKDDDPGLAKLAPGKEGLIDFSVSVISKPVNLTYRDYKIDSLLESEIARIGNVNISRKAQTGKVTIFINSDASLMSQARYYNDANIVVGSGPIPPKAGQKTTYKIYWSITNSMHELEDIEIIGRLPEYAVFEGGNADAGSIALDEGLRNVKWTLNRMPISVNNLKSEFSISVTPLEENIGSIISILDNIEFRAKDRSTGGIITLRSGDETSALPDDPFVTKGQVEN